MRRVKEEEDVRERCCELYQPREQVLARCDCKSGVWQGPESLLEAVERSYVACWTASFELAAESCVELVAWVEGAGTFMEFGQGTKSGCFAVLDVFWAAAVVLGIECCCGRAVEGEAFGCYDERRSCVLAGWSVCYDRVGWLQGLYTLGTPKCVAMGIYTYEFG